MGLPRRPRTTPHPTATLLLDTTVGLLETVPVDELTIAMVLERSGPLHHHYDDISDLVEQTVMRTYTRRLNSHQSALLDTALLAVP
jgi:hypothetical protein